MTGRPIRQARLARVADLARLLDVQDRDLALEQLRHRRESLPARASLADRQAAMERIGGELGELRARLDDLERSQARLEDEVTTIETKAAAEGRKLNSGTITAPREIQALSDEIDALGRRQRALEDQVIELMEQIEPLSADVTRLETQRDELDAEAASLRAEIVEQESAIAEELSSVLAAREEAAAGLDASMLERYDDLRARLGGVAVARLEGDRCLGCHISLPAMEVDAARHAPPGEIITHEECGRILVR